MIRMMKNQENKTTFPLLLKVDGKARTAMYKDQLWQFTHSNKKFKAESDGELLEEVVARLNNNRDQMIEILKKYGSKI